MLKLNSTFLLLFLKLTTDGSKWVVKMLYPQELYKRVSGGLDNISTPFFRQELKWKNWLELHYYQYRKIFSLKLKDFLQVAIVVSHHKKKISVLIVVGKTKHNFMLDPDICIILV